MWRIEYQQRGLPHVHMLFWTDCDTSDVQQIDRIVNARYQESSVLENERQMVSDYKIIIKHFQVHHHTRWCQIRGGKCKFGYPKPVNHTTEIQQLHYVFCRSEVDQDIVPHNLELLTLFRCHHYLEVIHSEKCIGYILKYCSKKSDVHAVSTMLYEGGQISSNQ
jgi:hypothetical protein